MPPVFSKNKSSQKQSVIIVILFVECYDMCELVGTLLHYIIAWCVQVTIQSTILCK